MAESQIHEPLDKLSRETLNMHRAISSLREEFEAVDWYQQRADACDDEELKAILIHNMDEELEHAAMVLEWIRRNNDKVDKYLKSILFTDGPIVGAEHGDHDH